MALSRTIYYGEAIRLETTDGPVVLYFTKSRHKREGAFRDQINIDAPTTVKIIRFPWKHYEETAACPQTPEPRSATPARPLSPRLLDRAATTPRLAPPVTRRGGPTTSRS